MYFTTTPETQEVT